MVFKKQTQLAGNVHSHLQNSRVILTYTTMNVAFIQVNDGSARESSGGGKNKPQANRVHADAVPDLVGVRKNDVKTETENIKVSFYCIYHKYEHDRRGPAYIKR